MIFNTKAILISTLDQVFGTEDKQAIINFIHGKFPFNPNNPEDYIRWDQEGGVEFSVEGNKTQPLLSNIMRAAQEMIEEQEDDDSWCQAIINAYQSNVKDELTRSLTLSGSFKSSLKKEDLTIIANAIKAHTYRFQWKKGDLLIVNNQTMTHSREPFSVDGRRIFVTKGSPQ